MYYPNYYPYKMNYNFNIPNENVTNQNNNNTIPFKSNVEEPKKEEPTREKGKLNIMGISLEIDDLIIIGIIILLFLEKDKNYTLIIILGFILLNFNLSDILNFF